MKSSKIMLYIFIALSLLIILLGPQAVVTGYHSMNNNVAQTNTAETPTDSQPLSNKINPFLSPGESSGSDTKH